MQRKTLTLWPRLMQAVAVLALTVGAASAQPVRAVEPSEAFDSAMLAYERDQWNDAYAGFAALADRGHAEAARVALQMWRQGPTRYRSTFPASAAQRQQWLRLVRRTP